MLKLKTKENEIIELRADDELLGTIHRFPPNDSENEISFGFDFIQKVQITRKKKTGRDTGNGNSPK